MKQINRILLIFLISMAVLSTVSISVLQGSLTSEDKSYLVEINRIEASLNGLQQEDGLTNLLSEEEFGRIEAVSFLEQDASQEEKEAFFSGKGVASACEYTIRTVSNEAISKEFIRYEYVKSQIPMTRPIMLILLLFLIVMLFVSIILLYVKYQVIKPFQQIESMPYELAKGNLTIDLKENKHQYFGKFLWGLDNLKEVLKKNQYRQLELEKEKKLMILTISHDIKTPLSSIYLYTKALQNDLYEGEAKQKEIYKKIEEKGKQIEGFISQIENMSTNDLLDIKTVKEEHYISEIIGPVMESYKEKLRLRKTEFVVAPYENRLIQADVDRVHQVFQNLIENAIKYGDGRYIKIDFSEEDYCQLITVRNSGIAMDGKNFSHMFESFWRGENASEKPGSGLGLYICKTIMNKLDGDIFAEAGEGEMSFTLVFPLEG